MDSTVRFSVSLPKALLDELDNRVIKKGYSSRSELIRDLIRELLADEAWEQGKEVIAVLSIVYNHHNKELVYRLLDLQHKYHINVLCLNHLHLDHDNCLETIILRGNSDEIESLSISISGLRGVKLAKLSKMIIPSK